MGQNGRGKTGGSAAERAAFTGLLFALAVALSYLENFIPAIGGLPPGVKPGLSNIVTMYCLYYIGWPEAGSIAFLKSGFVLLVRGPTAAALSFCGGLFSAAVMALLLKRKFAPSVGFVSVAGAVAHNLAQIAAARFLTGSGVIFFYIPVLVLSGIAAGLATGFLMRATAPYLSKIFRKKR